MARVLLLVPTTSYRATDFVEAARALGVEVVVASEQSHALAGAMGTRTLTVDFDDPEGAAEAIVAHDQVAPVDAVVAVDDQGTVVAAEAGRRLGLRHNPPAAARAARDKLAMRALLQRAEVPQPAWRAIPAGAGREELAALAEQVGLPCVVKPTTLSGSQGVLRADDLDALVAATERARGIAVAAGVDAGAPLLIERFVPGDEVAVEAMLRDGDLSVLAVFDKPDPLDGPVFPETIYVTPSRLPAPALQAAVAAVGSATRALGLTDGPVHGEARVHGERAWVVEVAARTIGGLCARTLSFGTGRSLESLVIANALGVGDVAPVTAGAAGVLMIPVPRAGILRGVTGVAAAEAVPGVTGVEITIAPGRPVAPVPDGNRYLGFVFARADTPAAAEQALRDAWAALEVTVDG
jgi:biotin carboxylase